jgi:hypothetical protein
VDGLNEVVVKVDRLFDEVGVVDGMEVVVRHLTWVLMTSADPRYTTSAPGCRFCKSFRIE